MTLILLLLIPLTAGLLCLLTSSRESWERLNLVAFALLVPLASRVCTNGVPDASLPKPLTTA